MAKMRPPCATLLILILVIGSAPQPSQSSFNQYRTLLSLSHSLLKRVANLRAERGDISGSNRVKLISQKLERGLGLGFFGLAWSVGSLGWDYMRNYAWRDHQELYGAVSDLNELMRCLNELMRVDSEMGRATWVGQNYGNVLGVSKRLFVRLLKVFSQSFSVEKTFFVFSIGYASFCSDMEGSCISSNKINGGMIKFKNRLCYCRKKAAIKISESQKNPSKLFFSCESRKCNFYMFWSPDQDEFQQSHSHSVDAIHDMHDANEVRNDVHFQDDRRAISKEFERKLNNVEVVVNTLKLLSIINIVFSGVAMFVMIMKNN
ncbi:hypothetical protein EZV62_027044 [Acer yangbiense]|uniref:Zinc finger GRF-type domain-containing protein n=1 Tax=Acer yangbiense TaxID=1000413 RepID=A0A5C7GT60_9ROSI|nr:hypothetical protein EZV62_027044 [Acer yangbiense]